MPLITIRRFDNEALAQMAVDILKQQRINAHIEGTSMDLGDAASGSREPYALLIATTAQSEADAILKDNNL